MGIEIRSISSDEVDAFIRADTNAFGSSATTEFVDAYRPGLELERTVAAFDGAQLVGTAATYSLEMTVPGGAQVPVGGLSWVGVLPTHRRRGLLRQMMTRHLDDTRERGEPLGALYASEAVLYRRYGYGIASFEARVEIDPKRVKFLDDTEPSGTFTLIDRETALSTLPPVHERYRLRTVGEIHRPQHYWGQLFAELDDEATGSHRPWFHVVHADERGDVDGYALYRFLDDTWEHGMSQMTVEVYDLIANAPAARAALWWYLLRLDLAGSLKCNHTPVDEPLRWMVTDPRQVRTTSVVDGLWLRPLDVARALEARGYATEGTLSIEVIDPVRPDTQGTYALDAGPEGAECQRTNGAADLRLDAPTLGSLYLGAASVRRLAEAGRVEELRPGAVARADALLRVERQPFGGTPF